MKKQVIERRRAKNYPQEFIEYVEKVQRRNPLFNKLKTLPQYEEWVKGTFIRPYVLLRNTIVPLMKTVPLQDLFILDNGCGSGSSTVMLSSQNASVIGLDIQVERIKIAKLRAKYHNVNPEFILGDAKMLPFQDGVFDLCSCIALIEHIDEGRDRCLRESFRILRKGGTLAITNTPNRLCPKDYHTTGLWFIPYMPKKLAHKYALFRGRIISEKSLEMGSTYWEIVASLNCNRIRIINQGNVDRIAQLIVERMHAPKQFKIATVKVLTRLIEKLCAFLKVPTNAIMPGLTLYIRKY